MMEEWEYNYMKERSDHNGNGIIKYIFKDLIGLPVWTISWKRKVRCRGWKTERRERKAGADRVSNKYGEKLTPSPEARWSCD